jgi:pheromone shutdown-related protein TraB
MIHRMTCHDKEIILVGTAHVSRDSAEQVRSVIESERPDTVCIELCPSRYEALRSKDRWRDMEIVKVIKENKAFLLLVNLLLAAFQKKIAKRFDIQPGAEMLAAIETGERYGAHIHLADRQIHTTLSRAWGTMSLWCKFKLFFQLIFSFGETGDITEEDIEKMKQEDVLETLLAEVGQSQPVLRQILIDERDQYLCENIRTAPGEKIVAVVGAGHVPGIKRYWNETIDMAALEVLPPKSRAGKILKWLLPLTILSIFLFGFFSGGLRSGQDMLVWWLAANGILAGLGAVLAMGHPLTILSSVLAAPLTSLNPMLAAGWVSGLVEALTRKPKVRDLENLQEDILSLRGFRHNGVTRVLLVVVLTNLGSSLGTMVAIPLMLKVLH